jgi:hypothetical protein
LGDIFDSLRRTRAIRSDADLIISFKIDASSTVACRARAKAEHASNARRVRKTVRGEVIIRFLAVIPHIRGLKPAAPRRWQFESAKAHGRHQGLWPICGRREEHDIRTKDRRQYVDVVNARLSREKPVEPPPGVPRAGGMSHFQGLRISRIKDFKD